jgi:hypothetical protein
MYNNFQNPYKVAIKKYLNDLLPEKYVQYQELIERLSHHMITEGDAKQFIQLAVDLYERGYTKAVDDYREKLEPYGIKISIGRDRET